MKILLIAIVSVIVLTAANTTEVYGTRMGPNGEIMDEKLIEMCKEYGPGFGSTSVPYYVEYSNSIYAALAYFFAYKYPYDSGRNRGLGFPSPDESIHFFKSSFCADPMLHRELVKNYPAGKERETVANRK